MERARRELLAGAALAGEQYGGLGAGELLDAAEDQLHGGRAADEVDEAVAIGDLGGEPPVLALEGATAQRALHGEQQGAAVERLGQVVVGARAHRLYGVGDAAVGGDHHEAGARVLGADVGEQLHAVAGLAVAAERELPVGEHEVDGSARELGEGGGQVGRLGDDVALGREHAGDQPALVGLVLDEEDALVGHEMVPPAVPRSRVAGTSPPATPRSPSVRVARVPPAERSARSSVPP